MANRHYPKRGKLIINKNSVSGETAYKIKFNGTDIPVVSHETGGSTLCFREVEALPITEVDPIVAAQILQSRTFVNKEGELIVKEERTHRQWFYDESADDNPSVHYYRHDGFSEQEYDNLPSQKTSSTSRSAPPATATASGGPE